MGAVNSTGNKLDRALAADLPEDERYLGLVNYGNTCYCNSVLQVLFHCEPFRRAVLEYERNRRASKLLSERSERGSFLSAASAGAGAAAANGAGVLKKVVGMGTSTAATNNGSSLTGTGAGALGSSSSAAGNGVGNGASSMDNTLSGGSAADEETMLTALAELFHHISTHKKRTGSVPPKSFVTKLREQNELFSSYMHQDAHEFLNFILNDIIECLRKDTSVQRRRREEEASINAKSLPQANGTHANGSAASPNSNSSESADGPPVRTFVHDLFEGKLSNEVRCLCCETVTQRVESFFDLSVDVEQNSSLTACLRNFSSTELLREQDKFYCDMCCSLQEAERRMRVKILPQILSLHLKRFKFMEQFKKYKKLSYRVVFPLELRLCNTSDDAEDPDRLYSLFAVVVHVGSGPNQGHYVSLIRSHGTWLMFDDDCVEIKSESELQSFFGEETQATTEVGYLFFYSCEPK